MTQTAADTFKQNLTFLGQGQCPMFADKKFEPDTIFQISDLLADRSLRQVQFLGSSGKAQMAGTGFETDQAGR